MLENWRKSLLRLASFQQAHPAVVRILAFAIPFLVPLLLTLGGDISGIVENGRLTVFGYLLLAICTAVPGIFELAAQEASKAAHVEEKNSLALSALNYSTRTICKSKLKTIVDALASRLSCKNYYSAQRLSDPKKQLLVLAEELGNCLEKMLWPQEPDRPDLFVSIIYRFPLVSKEWNWGAQEGSLSIADLLHGKDGCCSTLAVLLNSDKDHIFENSKELAYKDRRYIPNKRDGRDKETGGLKGSIACYRFEVKESDRILVDFVISIASYEREFVEECPDWDKQQQIISDCIRIVVMPAYGIRSAIELCLLYIEMLDEEYQKHRDKVSKKHRSKGAKDSS